MNMRYLIAGFLCVSLSGAALAAEGGKEAERLQKSAEVITEVMGTPEKGIPRDLLNKAVCVGVIPSEKKVALGVGGSFGRGVLVCRSGGTGAWAAPSMFTVGGANFGFQLGGQATDFVLVVMNAKGAEKLLQSKAKLGADASVAAGPVGRHAEGNTDWTMRAQVLTYSRARGVFAGVSLNGAVVKQDKDSTREFYGHMMTTKAALTGEVDPTPAANAFLTTLAKWAQEAAK